MQFDAVEGVTQSSAHKGADYLGEEQSKGHPPSDFILLSY